MRSSRPEFFPRRSLGAALLTWSALAPAQPNPYGGAPADVLALRASPDPEQRVILIVRTPGDDGVMTRLRAELMSSDWRVLEIRLDERQAPLPLATIAEQQRAGAAVRVDVRNGAVELWIAQPGGAIQESLAAPDARAHDQVLALRTAEALRARGLLLEPLARPEPEAEPESRGGASPVERVAQRAPVATPAAIEDRGVARAAPSRLDRSRLWLGLGPGIALSPGGLDSGIVGWPGVRLELGRWSFSAFGVLPVTRAEVSGSEGRARVATWLVGTATEIEWARSLVVGVRSGLGLGASATTMSGEPAAGYRGVDDSVFAVAGFLRSSITLVLGPSFRVGPLGLVGATVPSARVAFGGREAARWGQPFVVLGLMVEAAPLHWD
jgi:hypothetical protein